MRAMAAEIELVHSLAIRAGNVEPYDEARAAALQAARTVALSGLQVNNSLEQAQVPNLTTQNSAFSAATLPQTS